MIEKDAFDRHVKDALTGFYRTAVLQGHPLLEPLGLDPASEDAVPALRQALRQAIEGLKPAPTVSYGDASWLDYRVLWTRYVNARSQTDTCDELGISSSSYYRHHACAFEAVVQTLWCRHRALSRAAQGPAVAAPADLSAEAAELAKTSRRLPIQIPDLVTRAAHTLRPLLAQEGQSLHLALPPNLPTLYADRGLMNQILLVLATEATGLAEGCELRLDVQAAGEDLRWRLGPLSPAAASAQGNAENPRLALPQALIEAYGGELALETDGEGAAWIAFRLPLGRAGRVLVIDDSEDMVRLCRLYLQSAGLDVSGVSDRPSLEAQLDEAVPDVIILDILMPQWDGWSILSQLREQPITAQVPVIVCSVLEHPRLALALGADQVLQKPITQEGLVRAVERALEARREGDQRL